MSHIRPRVRPHARMRARMLADGQRLHLQDGPIDLVLGADGDRMTAFRAASERFATLLDELCAELPLLRQPARPDAAPSGAVARSMWAAVLPHASAGFITPMAAVAGAVAQTILAAMTEATPLERAFVNNGGDIALHLTPGRCFTMGMVDRPDCPPDRLSLAATARIGADDGIAGIATSGWRGRSFSLGIADSVTVLAGSAAIADATATVIANQVDLPGHPAVGRRSAVSMQPDSDLGVRRVTVAVGPLMQDEIDAALERGAAHAQSLLGDIHSAVLRLGGRTRVVRRN